MIIGRTYGQPVVYALGKTRTCIAAPSPSNATEPQWWQTQALWVFEYRDILLDSLLNESVNRPSRSAALRIGLDVQYSPR